MRLTRSVCPHPLLTPARGSRFSHALGIRHASLRQWLSHSYDRHLQSFGIVGVLLVHFQGCIFWSLEQLQWHMFRKLVWFVLHDPLASIVIGDQRRRVYHWARGAHAAGGATALLISALQPKGKWASWIYVPAFAIGASAINPHEIWHPHPSWHNVLHNRHVHSSSMLSRIA